jgi:hypothetical protein
MKTNLIHVSMLAVIAAAGACAQQNESSTEKARQSASASALEGVWDVSVTVVDCQSGALIRNVTSVQMFTHDGAMMETTNTGTRGPSLGAWFHAYGQTYGAAYWFYRYNSDGSFASRATANNTITLSPDGSQFTVTATIRDFDANNNLISTGCVSQTAKKM